MFGPGLTVFLVDDDAVVLKSQAALLESAGYQTRSFESAEAFMYQLSGSERGCIVTDFKLSGMSGLDMQRELKSRNSFLPIVVVSGHARVNEAVEFMEKGAVTLLQKPYKGADLLASVERALERFVREESFVSEEASIRSRLATLTQGEEGVLQMMIEGHANKVISQNLGISMRTVDRRRSAVLEKMDVKSAPELAALVARLECPAIEAVSQ